jgi:hypothetical protein
MKIRTLMLVLLVSAESMTLATAQSSREPMSRGESLPRLGDIMLAKQWRHIKLWFAGRQRNWDLAAYELAQLKANLAGGDTLFEYPSKRCGNHGRAASIDQQGHRSERQ